MPGLFLVPDASAGQPSSIYAETIEVFLASKAPQTRVAYTRDLSTYASYCGCSLVEAIEGLLSQGSASANLTVSCWKNQMKADGLSSSTINRRLACLKSLTAMALSYGISDVELAVANETPRPVKDTRGPTLEDVRQMLRRLGVDSTSRGVKANAVCSLLFDCALRRQELANLDLEDVDIRTGALSLVGKGNRRGVIMMPSPTMGALRRWLSIRGDSPGPLFPGRNGTGRISGSTIYRIVRENGGMRPHGLRHTSISTAARVAAREGLGLQDVQSFSRHRDPGNLFAYLDDDSDAQARLSQMVADSAHQVPA